MKKFLLLSMMLLGVLGIVNANAGEETLIKSVDYASPSDEKGNPAEGYPYYRMGDCNGTASFDVVDGVLVIANTQKQTNNYDLQPFILDWFNLQEGYGYKVVITMKADADGSAKIATGLWGNTLDDEIEFKASDEYSDVVVNYSKSTVATEKSDAHVLFQCGYFIGKVYIKGVKIYEIAPDEPIKEPVFVPIVDKTDLNMIYSKEYPYTKPKPGKVVDGAVEVQSAAKVSQDYDTQVWIKLPYYLPEGTKYTLEFAYQASAAAKVGTQAHAEPGDYNHWESIGDVNFATEWNTYVGKGTVNAAQAKGDNGNGKKPGMRSIAFNLTKAQDITYYIKDVVFCVDEAVIPELKTYTDEVVQSTFDANYEAAMAEIVDGNFYQISTKVGGTVYYLKEDGTLTKDESEAKAFQFVAQEGGDSRLYEKGWNLGNKFTNPSMEGGGNGTVKNEGHIRSDAKNDRNTWERQVFFKSGDDYAVRSTNDKSTSWGANTFWDVVDEEADPAIAGYSANTYYIWNLTDVTQGDAALAAAKENLKAALDAANNTIDNKVGVGEGAFMIPESALNTYAEAVAAQQAVYDNEKATVEEVEAATAALGEAAKTFAAAAQAPKAGAKYAFQSKQNDFFMIVDENGVTIGEEGTLLSFEDAGDGKYYVTADGEYYVGLAGTDNWSMSSAADNKAPLTISCAAVDVVPYFTLAQSKGMVGVDYPNKDNMGCWADKKTSDGDAVLWSIVEVEVGPKVIPNVEKEVALLDEVTSVDALKDATFYLVNGEGEEAVVLYIPDGWDFKVGPAVNAMDKNDRGTFLKLEPQNDIEGYLVPVFNVDKNARTGWWGTAYLNTQPSTMGNVIFGLAGNNDQRGQDAPNHAVWDITYEQGKGFVFHNVGRPEIYLGHNGTAAQAVEDVTYWRAYTDFKAGYDEDAVKAAYEKAIAAVRTTDDKTALEAAKEAYDEDADLEAFGDAVNKAVNVVNACEAVKAEYADLDADGAAVAKGVVNSYDNYEYADINELREAFIPAAKAQTTDGSNMTGAIINPSFEYGTKEGWTSDNCGDVANNFNFGARTGDKFCERWTQAPGTLSKGKFYQELTGMPNGEYKLTAELQNREQGNSDAAGHGFFLFANNDRTEGVTNDGQTIEVTTKVKDGNLTIGVELDGCTGNWVCFDNFQLTLVKAAGESDKDAWFTDSDISFKVNDYPNGVDKEAVADPRWTVDPTDESNGCIIVTSNDAPANDYDAQLFIVLPEKLKEGTELTLTMRVRADRAQAGCGAQAHNTPGDYNHWGCVSSIDFTTEWADYSSTITVSAAMEKGQDGNGTKDGMGTIAFNLSDVKGEKISNNFYFDDIEVVYTIPTALKGIDTAAQKANGKYFQNGQIFIMKNGVKYNSAGVMVK
ncbi:MAG: hypothetical protein IKN44_02645 [Bacteroidaceae bacterium]|nr:hypothetical protein [Bacteroidaceae bacterium]